MALDVPGVGVVVIVCVTTEPPTVTTWTLVMGVPVTVGDFAAVWVGAAEEGVGDVLEIMVYKELSSVTVVSTTTGFMVVFFTGVEEREGEEEDIRPAELVDITTAGKKL